MPVKRRPLTPAERAVIDRLLTAQFDEVEYFRAQVPALVVTGGCGCGCGTISFTVNPAVATRAPSRRWDDYGAAIAEATNPAWLMLSQSGGFLSELEHVADYGPNPADLDPSAIEPRSEVDQPVPPMEDDFTIRRPRKSGRKRPNRVSRP